MPPVFESVCALKSAVDVKRIVKPAQLVADATEAGGVIRYACRFELRPEVL